MARIREALETNEWESDRPAESFSGDGSEADGFGIEATEIEKEILELRSAMHAEHDENKQVVVESQGEEFQVEELEGLMLKLQAVKGTSRLDIMVYHDLVPFESKKSFQMPRLITRG